MDWNIVSGVLKTKILFSSFWSLFLRSLEIISFLLELYYFSILTNTRVSGNSVPQWGKTVANQTIDTIVKPWLLK